jgi:hypothetical protein
MYPPVSLVKVQPLYSRRSSVAVSVRCPRTPLLVACGRSLWVCGQSLPPTNVSGICGARVIFDWASRRAEGQLSQILIFTHWCLMGLGGTPSR